MFEGDYHDPVVWDALNKLKPKIGQHACSIVARYTAAPLYELERKLVGAIPIKCQTIRECSVVKFIIINLATTPNDVDQDLESFENYCNRLGFGGSSLPSYNRLIELRQQIMVTPMDVLPYKYVPVCKIYGGWYPTNVAGEKFCHVIFGVKDHLLPIPILCNNDKYSRKDKRCEKYNTKKVWVNQTNIPIKNRLSHTKFLHDHYIYMTNVLLDLFERS